MDEQPNDVARQKAHEGTGIARESGGRIYTWLDRIEDELILLDWKCANKVYADYLYQLAAYGLLWNENYPDHPPVGGFHLCRFAKEQGDFSHHYFPALDDEAETFLLMRDLFDRVKKAERRLR